MGLVGIAACKNGIVAIADYESDNTYKNKVGNIKEQEDRKRPTSKIFSGNGFVVVAYGSNIIKVRGKDCYLEDHLKFKKAKKIEKVLKKFNKKFFYKEFYGFLVGYIDKENKYQIVRYEFNLDTINPNKNKYIKTEYDENGVLFGGDEIYSKLMNIPFMYTKWETVETITNEVKTRFMKLMEEKKEENVSLMGKKELNCVILQKETDK